MLAPSFPSPGSITQTIKINVNEIPDVDRRMIAAAGSAMLARFFADPIISQKLDEMEAERKAASVAGGGCHV